VASDQEAIEVKKMIMRSVQKQQTLQNVHALTLRDQYYNEIQVNPRERAVARDSAADTNQFVFRDTLTAQAAQRIGRQMAAEIDMYSRLALPCIFAFFICVVFTDRVLGNQDLSTVLASISQNPSSQRGTSVVFLDNRTFTTGGAVRCYKNTGVLSTSAFNYTQQVAGQCDASSRQGMGLSPKTDYTASPGFVFLVLVALLGASYPIRFLVKKLVALLSGMDRHTTFNPRPQHGPGGGGGEDFNQRS